MVEYFNMVDDKYDVIIVGAGPAGLIAAKNLAGKKKVLVLEKNRMVGDKVCAGGLTVKDFKEFDTPKSLIKKEFRAANLFIYNRQRIRLTFHNLGHYFLLIADQLDQHFPA